MSCGPISRPRAGCVGARSASEQSTTVDGVPPRTGPSSRMSSSSSPRATQRAGRWSRPVDQRHSLSSPRSAQATREAARHVVIGQAQAKGGAAAAEQRRQLDVRRRSRTMVSPPGQNVRPAALRRPSRSASARTCSSESTSSWMPFSLERCFAAMSRAPRDSSWGSAQTPYTGLSWDAHEQAPGQRFNRSFERDGQFG